MSNTDRIDSSTQVLAVRCVCDRGHVLSCQALNVAASQGPSSSGTYRVLKAPGHGYLWPGCVPSQGGENTMGRQVVKSCPSVAIMMGDMSSAYYSWI
jgi:hypothetical protein